MRPLEPFDPLHHRCVWPTFGRECAEAFDASPLTISDIAREMKVSHEVVRGYRRGFARPTTTNAIALERLLKVQFTLDEPKNDKEVSAAAREHVAALRKLGYVTILRRNAR
jgi:ribosome-binding protein aMBF1 (putative translation factor)